MQLSNIEKALRLIDLKRFEGAVSVLLEGISDDANEPYVFYLLAFSYLELKDFPRARHTIELGLKADANFADLYGLRANYYEEVGKTKQAFEAIFTALEINPEEVSFHATLARLYLNTNQHNDTEIAIRNGLQVDAEFSELYYYKSALRAGQGKNEKALLFVNKALEFEPNNEVYLALRARLQIGSNSKEAEENAIAALRQNPLDENSRSTLLEVYKNKNWLLRFFVGNSFSRFIVEWTAVRVIIVIICWKGVLIWGGFGLLYLVITWYGGVFYNTAIRPHKRYQLLLTKNDIRQSNFFLGMNGAVLLLALLLKFGEGSHQIIMNSLIVAILSLFIGISYFEIQSKKGKRSFFVFCLIAGALLAFVFAEGGLVFIALAVFTLLMYAFLFSFRINAY